MYFSRVKISPNHLNEFAKQFQYNHYQLHQLLWQLFQDKPDKDRDFLFRQDMDAQGLPVFYLLSKYKPSQSVKTLVVETRDFDTENAKLNLKAGDRLQFNLRANPVSNSKQERNDAEKEQYLERRKEQNLKEKLTKKRIHHDVVMHLKKSLSDAEKANYTQAELEQLAGEKWLAEKSEKNGFKLLSVTAQGYQQHQFKKRQIKISTLDFDGILEITDPELFKLALFNGIGSAKAFGCGLMLIKRA